MTTAFQARKQPAFGCNGADQYVEIAESATLRPAEATPFSICAWITVSEVDDRFIFSNQSDSFGAGLGGPGISLETRTGGEIRLALLGSTSGQDITVDCTEDVVSIGKRVFVCAVSDGTGSGGIDLYADGVLLTNSIVSDDLATSIVSTGPIVIGSRAETAGFLPGHVNHVQFYDYALTATDVTRLYDGGRVFNALGAELSGADAFGYWQLETDALDSGTGENDGTINGGAGFQNTDPVRPPSVSAGFNGTDQYAAIAHDAGLTFVDTEAYTVVAWVASDGSDAGYVLSKLSATNRGWGVALTSDGKMQHFQNGVPFGERHAETALGALPTDNELHLLIWSYDGSEAASGFVFSSGLVDKPGNTLQDTAATTYGASEEINLAARSAGTGAINKINLAWVAVYSGVLSAPEMQAIFDAGPFAPPPHANRLLTTWLKNGSEQTVPAFPSDATLVNGPVYRRERFAPSV